MSIRNIVAASVLGLAAAGAFAASGPGHDGKHDGRGHHGGHASVERVAMRNILTEQLSQRTGKPQAEIAALLKDARPHEVAEKLGLDPEATKQVFGNARETLLQRSVSAGLITAAQATEIRAAQAQRKEAFKERREERRGERRRGEGEGEGEGDGAPE